MSTTTERDVAMGYAAGDQSKMGIVIEVQQGMVSRGADISWLSQYPHERESMWVGLKLATSTKKGRPSARRSIPAPSH